MRRVAAVAAIIALLSAAVPTIAAYPVGKYGDGASIAYTYFDRDGDGTLSWDDSITLLATPPSRVTAFGDIQGSCVQSGTVIYSAYSWLNSTWTRTYRLDSQAWTDATGATCSFAGVFVDGRKVYTFGEIYFSVAP